jgi:hypothetical protein
MSPLTTDVVSEVNYIYEIIILVIYKKLFLLLTTFNS